MTANILIRAAERIKIQIQLYAGTRREVFSNSSKRLNLLCSWNFALLSNLLTVEFLGKWNKCSRKLLFQLRHIPHLIKRAWRKPRNTMRAINKNIKNCNINYITSNSFKWHHGVFNINTRCCSGSPRKIQFRTTTRDKLNWLSSRCERIWLFGNNLWWMGASFI